MSVALAKARLAACKKWPFASQAILSLVPVPKPGFGTLAVDQHWRLYYDERWLLSIGEDLAAGVILHEMDHLLKKHHKRAAGFVPDNPDAWKDWNLATDAAINEGLRRERVRLPDDCIYPETLEQEEGLSAEEYFRALRKAAEAKQSEEVGDDGETETVVGEDGEGEGGESDAAATSDGDDGEAGEGTGSDPCGEPESGGEESGAGEGEPGASGEAGEAGGSGEGDSEPCGEPGEGTDGDESGPGGSSQGDCGSEGGRGESPTSEFGPGEDASDCDTQGGGGGEDSRPDAGDAGETGGECPDGGSGHDGRPGGPGVSGSCSDGRQRPWELGPPTDDNPGLDEADAEQVIRVTADNIERGVGNASAGHKRWASDMLNPVEDPASRLLHLIRQHVDLVAGEGERSYRRPSRRNSDPRMCLPGNVSPVPRITVIVDTSGSMEADDLGLAIAAIRSVIDSFRIRDGIKVITGDCEGQSKEICLNDPADIDLRGGGGTDMAVLVAEAMAEEEEPQMVLVCTDGWTPWPVEDIGVPLVACLSRKPHEIPECYRVPDWMEVIQLR